MLEEERRKAINSVGLEPSVGFLHDFSDYQTKQSLVYDLQEPFRWLSDVSVIQAFESGGLDLPDFYFTGDDYRYRFEAEAKQRFIDMIRERFNAGVTYNARDLKWDTVIEQKANELGKSLVGRLSTLDFTEPSPKLLTHGDPELKAKVLALTQSEAGKHGIGKSTLHYLRKRAQGERSLRLYPKVQERLI